MEMVVSPASAPAGIWTLAPSAPETVPPLCPITVPPALPRLGLDSVDVHAIATTVANATDAMNRTTRSRQTGLMALSLIRLTVGRGRGGGLFAKLPIRFGMERWGVLPQRIAPPTFPIRRYF